ncbi:ribosome maturation factor RimM [Alkalilimnicola ehrlichii]|uniref:Ribosome maturation factor RimM n=1 Tax=Alkalilimnicola ehrlichii TaxID=351052 RepID=A0A3E0X1X2_9GAMM|nr:ribosome maturation factor RimM [Alkalilimnicola ehrlichii]RFA30868.1 ribosome maturation factor RimM [Alkalilimnicola ehrlichii]RFA38819.1 ribosome maturation factor RimM [Alkalilimnicola ehrlichii]
MTAKQSQLLTVGRISGLYGVRGWVRIFSYTEPRERILEYVDWHLRSQDGWREVELAEGRRHGKGIVARIEGVDDREQARALIGSDIGVSREQLPALEPGEYYWVDLEGLQVETESGHALGVVDYLFETGANDVLVVKGEDRERLLPFVLDQVVKRVDLESGLILVDWDPEF